MRVGFTAALVVLWAAPAASAFEGSYANAMMAGHTVRGRPVAIVAGTHTSFPYDGSTYDQLAVQLGAGEPVLVTGRPHLRGFRVDARERSVRFSYRAARLVLDLEFAAVRHPDRFEGDPAQLGDFFVGMGFGSSQSPGFVYTPYELMRLVRGELSVRGRRIALGSLHGQHEQGRVEAPDDPRFESAYDYLAAPTASPKYTYVGFVTHALHSGSEGALDSYFRDTASDEMTMEGGTLVSGDPHGAPDPFDNRGRFSRGQWAVDLGPGTLYRKLVAMSDRDGRPLVALSETIAEGGVRDRVRPGVSRVRKTRGRLSFDLSEDALVRIRMRGRREPRVLDGHAGRNSVRARRPLVLWATDEVGNRSRRVRR